MCTAYETDVILWAKEQAEMLRSGQFNLLDIEHIADEIEDVWRAEQREFCKRLVTLFVHLLKWQIQTAYRSKSWEMAIKAQRNVIARQLERTPSLNALLDDEWFNVTWSKAVAEAVAETGLDLFPEKYPWTKEQIIESAFLPND